MALSHSNVVVLMLPLSWKNERSMDKIKAELSQCSAYNLRICVEVEMAKWEEKSHRSYQLPKK